MTKKEPKYEFPKEVEINGIMHKIPLGWKDINIRQYTRLTEYSKYNDIEFLSIMLDVPQEDILNCEIEDIDLIVYSQVGWYMEQKDKADEVLGKKMTPFIKIDEFTILIPEDLKMKSYGQKVSAEQLLEKAEGKNPFAILADILSIYLYPEFMKLKLNQEKIVFDYEKAMEFKEKYILTIPITEGYPVGSFFLKRLTKSWNRKIHIWLDNIPKKRRQQILELSKNLNNLEQ